MKSWDLYNPRTGEKIKSYSYQNQDQVFHSIKDLSGGYQTWKSLSPQARQIELKKFAEYMRKNKQQWAESISSEMGKSMALSLAEVQKCIESLDYLCSVELAFLNSIKIQNSTYKESEVFVEPIGIILAIMPWNYPIWQVLRMIAPVLLSGNVVLLKHSELSPTAGDLFVEAFKSIGLQDILKHELFSHEDTEKIISDERVAGASITGSLKAGQIISSLCGKHMKKCVLELGGSDPYILLDDCDFDQAAQTLAVSRLQNAGQVCISAKRVLVSAKNLSLFTQKISKEFDQILNDPKDNLMGPLAHAKFIDSYNQQIQDLSKDSQKVYEKTCSVLNKNEHTAYVNPAILVFSENNPKLKETEIFGPGLIVIAYKNLDEAIQIANSTDFGLGAGVFGKNIDQCKEVARKLQSGQVAINDYVKTDARLPFGGMKKSGLGREVGVQGFLEFTQTKVISVK